MLDPFRRGSGQATERDRAAVIEGVRVAPKGRVAHVVAVDVGYGQLAHKLRIDPRVTNLERTVARVAADPTFAKSLAQDALDWCAEYKESVLANDEAQLDRLRAFLHSKLSLVRG